jgi:hypothetical protein
MPLSLIPSATKSDDDELAVLKPDDFAVVG